MLLLLLLLRKVVLGLAASHRLFPSSLRLAEGRRGYNRRMALKEMLVSTKLSVRRLWLFFVPFNARIEHRKESFSPSRRGIVVVTVAVLNQRTPAELSKPTTNGGWSLVMPPKGL